MGMEQGAGKEGGAMDHKIIIAVAPNGARRTKQDHPALPMVPAELAETAWACQQAGAAMLHLHVRDDLGQHSLDPDRYRAAIQAIRAKVGPDLLIQATTEAVGRYSPPEQIAAMDALQPEAFSVAVRELFAIGADPVAAAAFLARHTARGALIQHILYDVEDIHRFTALVSEGRIPLSGGSVIFPLGRYVAGQQSRPQDLLPFLTAWSLPLAWMVCAFGVDEAACGVATACLGGHVRVGFENNLLMPDGTMASDNAALVGNVGQIMRTLGRRLANGTEARAILRGRS